MNQLRFTCRRLKASPEGNPGFSIGLRLGYWPCLKAPYIQLSFLLWRLSLWFGLESYKKDSK